ncbi:MAG: hypothetical protein EA379_01285 [Phycisphaerales bacterium]|nr:MAG: hypothetical protein EA379_01285 [Phycisphaerales bacterium]
MARRNNRLSVGAGPTWTDVFRSADAGGADGRSGARELLLSCAADSDNPIEYRVEAPADPADQQARLNPGEAARIRGANQFIRHVVMRGVGGAATGGVEEISF